MQRPDLAAIATRATATIVVALLASCGGGGGNPGVTSADVSSTSTSNASGTGLPALPAPPSSSTSTSTTGSISISTSLNGSQAVPANNSTANGSGNITVDTSTGNFTASLTTTGIVPTAVFIYQGAQGTQGLPVFQLVQTTPGSNTWVTSGKLTSGQISTLNAGQYYFNVLSATFPNGEIRGQLQPPQAITITPPAVVTPNVGLKG
jgi:hypothetical protein